MAIDIDPFMAFWATNFVGSTFCDSGFSATTHYVSNASVVLCAVLKSLFLTFYGLMCPFFKLVSQEYNSAI